MAVPAVVQGFGTRGAPPLKGIHRTGIPTVTARLRGEAFERDPAPLARLLLGYCSATARLLLDAPQALADLVGPAEHDDR